MRTNKRDYGGAPIDETIHCIGMFVQCERCEMWAKEEFVDIHGNNINIVELMMKFDKRRPNPNIQYKMSFPLELVGGKHICVRCYNETNGGKTLNKQSRIRLK